MTTPNFSITEVAAAQAQKYVTVNEALRVIDTAMNLTVIRADNTAPPGSPSEGDKYIPFAPATGAWSGKENQVAVYINSAWVFFVPAEGWRAYNQTTNTLMVYDGSNWDSLIGSLFSSGDLTIDNAGSDSYLNVNKNAVGDDASLAFKTNSVHHASFGLQGDNNFTLKVGSGFDRALVIANDVSKTDLYTPELNLTEANGGALRLRVIEEHLTGLSGATVTSSAAFPNQSIILGVSLRVTTTITGASSFDSGDGSTSGRFGGSLGTAAGTTNQGTIGPSGNYGATNVVLTANGSNFTGGAVRVCLIYLELITPTS